MNPHKNALDEVFTTLRYINLAIAVYYILEQIAKLWAYGIVYCQKIEFLYDGLVSAALITIQIIEQTFITSADNSADTGYKKTFPCAPFSGFISEWVWILSRIINILIMLRLLRILPRVPALALVMGSLLETLKNLKHCAGILFAAFYLYASFGMILFQGESSKILYSFKYSRATLPLYRLTTTFKVNYITKEFKTRLLRDTIVDLMVNLAITGWLSFVI